MLMDKVTGAPLLDRTPSGETLQKTRNLVKKLQADPKMRRAVKAALKAMGLPDLRPDSNTFKK